MTEIIIIAAMAKNGVIGNGGEIPWCIPEDVKRFRDLTLGHPVIMGRKTYESIKGPLNERTSYVVTRNDKFRPETKRLARNGWIGQESDEKAIILHSLEDAIERASGERDEIYVIGGGEIYRQSMDLATRLCMTEIKRNVEGDTYFPEIEEGEWVKTEEISRSLYSFVNYVRT